MSTHEPSEGRPPGYPQGQNEDRGQSGRRGPHADRQDGRSSMENLSVLYYVLESLRWIRGTPVIEHQLHGTC